MNLEKVDNKTLTLVVLACTAVAVGVLIIDVQVAKTLAAQAEELKNLLDRNQPRTPLVDVEAIRRFQNEVARNHGTTAGPAVDRDHGGGFVGGSSGVEAGADSSSDQIPMEGWDVFPVTRTTVNGTRGIGNLAIPEKRGEME